MKASTAVGTAAVVVLAGLFAAGCADPPTHGYVYSINYNPPGSYYIPGYDDSWCSGSGKYRSCYDDWVPGRTVYVPPEWQLELCQKQGTPSSSNKCGWRDVDSQTYHTVRLGQFWTAVAGVSSSPTGT